MSIADLSWWNELAINIHQTFNETLVTVGGKGIISIGLAPDGFPIRFYGLAYLAALYTVWVLAKRHLKKHPDFMTEKQLESLFAWGIVGLLLGARFGYVLFYKPEMLSSPMSIINPFQGGKFTGIAGMSFHGGLLGGIISAIIFFKKNNLNFWKITNLIFLLIPVGYTWGRLGNFMNGELYGRVTDSFIGMVFPLAKDGFDAAGNPIMRHPSQLYEAFFEGIFLFGVMKFLSRYDAFKNHMMALFIFGYGFVRFFIEYFREPDSYLPLNEQFLQLSRGQLLCILMMVGSTILWWVRRKREVAEAK